MPRFKNMLDFTDKNIVVLGGLGLIGSCICDAFMEFGGNVIIADIDKDRFEELKEEKGLDTGKCHFEYFDISDTACTEKHFQGITERYQTIDVWINLAYPRTADWGKTTGELTFESWDENVRMHLGGYFWASKLVLEYMKKQGHGCLINFGSIYGIVAPHFDIYAGTDRTMPVAYSAIKGAIVNLSRYFAALYGPHNIRVNTVCPGGIEDNQEKEFIGEYSKLTPLRRMGKPEEIALPTLFLASDGASYINGHTLLADGGWTAW